MVSVQDTYRVRRPAVAGSFYPRGANELERVVANLLDAAFTEARVKIQVRTSATS